MTRGKIMAWGFLGVLLTACGGGGGGGGGGGTLTPARNLVGTWTTPFAVAMDIQTDFCTPNLSLVATENWTATWIITATSDPSVVDIEMQFNRSGFQTVQSCGGTGYVPDFSPMSLTGTVSGSSLMLTRGSASAGNFTFTTDLMQGTWDNGFCLAFCQRILCQTNAFKLTRQ